jgi:hypothetical protein
MAGAGVAPAERNGNLPKQNRPVVRDGRLQTRKKRTDRSYLGGAGGAPAAPPREAPPAADEVTVVETEVEEVAETVQVPSRVAPPPRPAAPVAAQRPADTAASTRLPAAARALQQQGVRKRRELDLGALARRDTEYAIHELRRIAILATMVIVTLVVLGIVLR